MKIDLEAYSANKKFIMDWAVNKGGNDPAGQISILASITFVPAIVCAYWIGEATGYPDKVQQHIKSIIDFYGYTEIENKPPNAPF